MWKEPLSYVLKDIVIEDLVRWGIVKEVFDDLRADEIWRKQI